MAHKLSAVAIALGLIGAVALTACGEDDPEVEHPPFDLVIGDSIPLTGDLAEFGAAGQKAADLAVEEINDAIGQADVDQTVEIVHHDNASDPAVAESAARRMISEDDVSCLIGAWGDEETVATAENVAIPEEVLQISPAASAVALSELDDNGLVVRTVPPYPNQGEALADAIADELGGAEGATVSVAAGNDSGGRDVADAFVEQWEQDGGTIGATVFYAPGQPSYDQEAAELTEGDPNAFVLADSPQSIPALAGALEETGAWDPARTWGSSELVSSDLAVSSGALLSGLRAIAPGVPADDESSIAFDQLFRSTDPEAVTPQRFAAQQFDAVILCYIAAVAAGNSEGLEMASNLIDNTSPAGEQLTWEELADAIEALEKDEDIDYQGASGPIDLDENGDATAGVYDVFTFGEGTLELTEQIPVPSSLPTPAD